MSVDGALGGGAPCLRGLFASCLPRGEAHDLRAGVTVRLRGWPPPSGRNCGHRRFQNPPPETLDKTRLKRKEHQLPPGAECRPPAPSVKWASAFLNPPQLLPQKHLPQEPSRPVSSRRPHRQQGCLPGSKHLQPSLLWAPRLPNAKRLNPGLGRVSRCFWRQKAFRESGNAAGVGVLVYPVGTSVPLCVSCTAPGLLLVFQGKQAGRREARDLCSQPGGARRGDTRGPGQTSAPAWPPSQSLPSRAQHGPPHPRGQQGGKPGTPESCLETWPPCGSAGAGGPSPACQGEEGPWCAHSRTDTCVWIQAHSHVGTPSTLHTQSHSRRQPLRAPE